MRIPRSPAHSNLALLLGALLGVGLVFGWAGPAHAQDADGQSTESQPSASQENTGPVPLISVIPGPAVPPGGPPPSTGEKPPLPDLYSQPVGPFTMYMDVIATGPSAYGLFTAPGCVLDGVFKRGMKLVWRFEVYDMATGRRVTDRDGATVSISLPDGSQIPARFDQRAPPGEAAPDSPWTWVAVWNIPPDYPLGPVEYAVNVSTSDGRSAALRPATWGSVYPQIVD
ncbi:MAG TPA: hypothetical protein VFC51_17585 [Chloroflexota bacterium]|nr:hypothetical protein [Chloroflexota bacterium]